MSIGALSAKANTITVTVIKPSPKSVVGRGPHREAKSPPGIAATRVPAA